MTATDQEQTVTVVGRDLRRRRWSRRWRRLRPFLYAGLLVAVVAGGAWLVLFSSVVTVRDVSVQGNQTLSGVRVRAVAKVPIGRPLARVDLGAIHARLETIPAVRRVTVSRSWPHTVAISITERTPVAVVDRGGGLQAVDEEGVLFGRYPTRPADLPLLQTAPDVKSEALAEAAHVVTSLRPDILSEVDRVDVRSVDEIRLLLSDGRSVLWGSAEDSAEKAAVLAVLLRQEGVHEIDVSVPGRPTTR